MPWLSGPVLLHGSLDSVAHSLRPPLLSWLSITFVSFTFTRPWSVFPTSSNIVTSFLYGKSVVPQVGLSLGFLDFFFYDGLVSSLPRLCTVMAGHHVTGWRTMEPFARLACSAVMTWTYVDG